MVAYRKFAYVYDQLMADMPYEEWLAFARKAWSLHGEPRIVAELGCGTGSITIPLAFAGYQIIGMDISEDMLAVAQSNLEGTPQGQRLQREGHIRWMQQDMRDWELPEAVDAVISFCDCLNYVLEEEEVAEVFSRTYQGLKPGGTFIFDVHHPRTFSRYMEEQPFVQNDPETSYIWTCDLDEERMEIEHHLSIFVQASETQGQSSLYERFEETHVQRAYDPNWIKAELQRVGFVTVECYGDFEWEEPGDNTQRLFYVAVKP